MSERVMRLSVGLAFFISFIVVSQFTLLEVQEAIGYIEECRDIHIDWAEYLTDNPEYDSTQIGNAEWHWEWVRRYNHVLNILYRMEVILRHLPPRYDTCSYLR